MPLGLFISNVAWDPVLVSQLSGQVNCQNCGTCCRKPEAVATTEAEVEGLATVVGKDASNLKKGWRRLRDGVWSLPTPCPYRKEERCKVYGARPFSCRIYPMLGINNDGRPVIGVSTVFCRAGDSIIWQLRRWAGGDEW